MNTHIGVRSGTLERLCPIAGSMGEWMAVIDGQAYLTWPASAVTDSNAGDADQRCRGFRKGKRVRFETDGAPTAVPTGRRAGVPTGPPTARLLTVEE